MAEQIQKHPGGAGVRRQHIESLLRGEVDLPRYIEPLAAAMNSTTDVLLKGAYAVPLGEGVIRHPIKSRAIEISAAGFTVEEDGVRTFTPRDRAKGVKDAVLRLREAMQAVDADIREAVVSQLSSMARRIEDVPYATFVAENIERQLSFSTEQTTDDSGKHAA